MDGMREKLAAYKNMLLQYVRDGRTDPSGVAEVVYNAAMEWLQNPNQPPEQMSILISLAEDTLNITYHNQDQEVLGAARAKLGLAAAEAVAKRNPENLTGSWEDVVWSFLSLAWDWDPDLYGQVDMSDTFKNWFLNVLSNNSLCPNPHLRLEMIRFMEILPPEALNVEDLGSRAIRGIMNVCCHLELEYLMPSPSRPSLTMPIINVLRVLHNQGHINSVAEEANSLLKDLQVDTTARCLANILELAAEMSQQVKEMYRTEAWDEAMTIMMLNRSLSLLEICATLPPFRGTCQHPGLVQYAASSLVTIVDAVLSCSGIQHTPKKQAILDVLGRLDSLLAGLAVPSNDIDNEQLRTVWTVAQKDHAWRLNEIHDMLYMFSLKLYNLPKGIEDTDDCIPEFYDKVTHCTMISPVKLGTSGEVVDEASLVHLLLEKIPRDPFTRKPLDSEKHMRLPELKAQIDLWRATNKRRHIL
ncbi:unnamed protein product [Meganyctiphanes norvegica]|uniref:U-box domain-containing protein n=1 Tax=Meganyctiphanes norvegica TaxID=48144 RepID=A0AAV2PZZ0_MEGNR